MRDGCCLTGPGMEQEYCWLFSVLRVFTNLVSITVPFGDTYWHEISSPSQEDPYLLLRHSCHAVSCVISNRKMPNEGRLCCQRMSERLCPVGRVRFLHSHFQFLT